MHESRRKPPHSAYFTGDYLAGHLDGLGRDALEEMQEDLEYDGRIGPRVVDAVRATRAMWDTRDRWPGLSVFDGLKDALRSALADHGILLHPLPDGRMRVDVPFTPETMPN